jgi:hypothetical protein
MAGKRIRIGRLENVGQVAYENAKVYRTLASRLSQILINQRVILKLRSSETDRTASCTP